MRRTKPHPIRNKIDLADLGQVRVLTRRWGITAADLHRIVGKVGNSIAAASKEIDPRKAPPLRPALPVQIDPASFPAVDAVLAGAQATAITGG
jgi:hypothetical protein